MKSMLVRWCLVVVISLTLSPASAENDKIDSEKNPGYLFSAFDVSSTSFAKEWARILPELKVRFPGLRFNEAEVLHITVIYIGEFLLDDLDVIEGFRTGDMRLSKNMTFRAGILGRKNNVIGLDLIGLDSALDLWVREAKTKLNDLALKEAVPDRDMHYRPHITLAYLNRDADPAELDTFFNWVMEDLDTAALTDSLEVLPYHWMVAGSDYRHEGEKYITTDVMKRRMTAGD